MRLKCILDRPDHVDRLYGTGAWRHLEVKDVPDVAAGKMLKHIDVYERADDSDEAGTTVTPAPPEKEDPLQETFDKITNFTKAQAVDFLKQNYRYDIDLKKYTTIIDIRAHTRMLVEQYGVA
jgi:hypothetical protein